MLSSSLFKRIQFFNRPLQEKAVYVNKFLSSPEDNLSLDVKLYDEKSWAMVKCPACFESIKKQDLKQHFESKHKNLISLGIKCTKDGRFTGTGKTIDILSIIYLINSHAIQNMAKTAKKRYAKEISKLEFD